MPEKEWKDNQYNPAPEEKEFLEEYFKRYKIQDDEDMSEAETQVQRKEG